MSETFKEHKTGDVIMNCEGRVMLITGTVEPYLYTAIDYETGEATAIDVLSIDAETVIDESEALLVRQAYLDGFYHPLHDTPESVFIEAMLGNREGTHADLLAVLRRAVCVSAEAVRSTFPGSKDGIKAQMHYIRDLERHYQAVNKFNAENDDYRNTKHSSPAQPELDAQCVFWRGDFCDCDVPDESGDWCSTDEDIIPKNK